MAQTCPHCGQFHPSHVTVCPITGLRVSPYTLVNEDEVLVGSVVAERYHVRDVLGQGTTGTVFAVEHLAFPRPAAMKVLRPRYVPLETVVRVFHGEAQSALTLSHACLPEVFDIGQLPDGAPYLVMERLQGETLAARLRRERLSLAAAVDVMMQLLSAIEAIHARDLLLRDLRPQNVFLAHRRGCRPLVKILDFGLARLIPLEKVQEEWDALRSVENANDGTGALSIPYYLSPERTRGEHGIEPVSDLFVAAAIFYESLTGTRLFGSTSFNGLLLQIAQSRPSPLGELRPEVPAEMDDLVMRTLAPNPRSRPQTARELQDELRSIFETTRRGSTKMRAAPASASIPVSVPHSMTPATRASGQGSDDRTAKRPASPVRRQSSPSFTLTSETGVPTASPSSQMRSAAAEAEERDEPPVDPIYEEEQTRTDRRYSDLADIAAAARRVDEASAESPHRTVPPPADAGIPVDVELETDTLGGAAIEAALNAKIPEDEETATMEISPELRARMDQLSVRTADSFVPPTTRAKPRG